MHQKFLCCQMLFFSDSKTCIDITNHKPTEKTFNITHSFPFFPKHHRSISNNKLEGAATSVFYCLSNSNLIDNHKKYQCIWKDQIRIASSAMFFHYNNAF